MADIKKVAVIGAGVMGAGIAAHVANAGIPVVLLDIVPKAPPGEETKDAKDRDVIAKTAVEKMLKTEPAPFMSKAAAKLVTTGNIEDHLGLLADCDWIVEAIIERLDLKQALYAKIEAHRKPQSIVSSNTSTIALAKLVEGLPPRFAEDFMITHFFNPPRYMRLLEIVPGVKTRAEDIAVLTRFADEKLGKSVVHCKDRPGFIANRLGVLWLQSAVVEAINLKLEVEEADAIISRPMGVPKTGVFGLLDLVGLDLMPHVNASMASQLPHEDMFHVYDKPIPLIERMIKDGYTGRKGKGGFYRVNKAKGKAKEAIDLVSGEYRPQAKAEIDIVKAGAKNLKALLDDDSKYGRYAWAVLSATLSYAADLVGDAADEVEAIDESMRLGYNWKEGPFEILDKLGSKWFAERLAKEGRRVPSFLAKAAGRPFYRIESGKRQVLGLDGDYRDLERAPGVVMLEDIKLNSKPILSNASAALWDIGDGVACFEITSKMNAIDADILEMLHQSITHVGRSMKALVIYSDAANFSAGANLGLMMGAAKAGQWQAIEGLIAKGQETYKALKYAPFPSVAGVAGLALGGGCELALHCSAIQAHGETYAGLVEVGVGLIPGWGGCKEMLARWQKLGKLPKGPMPAISQVFGMISTAQVSKSAADAAAMLILRPGDRISMNRYRLLADAKARALELVPSYAAPEPPVFMLPGASAQTALKMAVDGFVAVGKATPHDVVVAKSVAHVLSGGDTDIIELLSEDQLFGLERSEFMKLAHDPASQARIVHMLDTGRPLRN